MTIKKQSAKPPAMTRQRAIELVLTWHGRLIDSILELEQAVGPLSRVGRQLTPEERQRVMAALDSAWHTLVDGRPRFPFAVLVK